MTKIWTEIAKITEQIKNLDYRVRHLEDVNEWIAKLVIGTLILSIIGSVVVIKGKV